jgi:hypothetical protein
MTSTPLFDAIARRIERSVVPPIVPAGYVPVSAVTGARPAAPARPLAAVRPAAPVATVRPAAADRPVAALRAGALQEPVAAPRPVAVPAEATLAPALVAEIDAIPATVSCPDARVFDLDDARESVLQLSSADSVVLAAAGDALIRRVVEAVDAELEGVPRRRRTVVDAFGDRLTQLLVDTIADELDRIESDRAIRRA